MKYIIKIRQLTDQDLGRDCQFPNTDTENYIHHVDCLLENLKDIETVDTVKAIVDTIFIESQLSNKDDFWNSVKFLFEAEKEDIKFVVAKQVEMAVTVESKELLPNLGTDLFFHLFAAKLQEFLKDQSDISLTDLQALMTDLNAKQISDWLDRAENENLVARKGRFRTYQLAC